MPLDQLLIVIVLVAMMVALLTQRVSPATGVVGALLVLYLAGVVDADTAFGGFSNPAPLTVAALYVVAGGVERSGALLPALRLVLGVKTLQAVLIRLGVSVAVLSAVVANTPVVAMLISPIRTWAEGRRTASSKLLIPLSYAAIIGGNLTLVGTSTNLVASGMLDEAGLGRLSFWEPARLGLPFTLVALVALVALAPVLMPTRGGPDNGDGDRSEPGAGDGEGDRADGPYLVKPFVVSLSVDDGGPLDGVSIADGGLRALPSTYLVGVERDDEIIAPVGPEHILHGGDILTFAGRVSNVVDLDRVRGLTLDENKHVWSLDDGQHAWFEAIIGAASPLVGHTIKQVGFRERYQAAVVAINQSGEVIDTKLGDVRLQVGDSLLLVADLGFRDRWRHHIDFLFIHQRNEAPPTAQAKAPLALAILLATVALPIFGVTDVLYAAVVGATAMVAGGVLTVRQAAGAISVNVIAMIGAAIGIGAAVRQSGLAQHVATVMTDLTSDSGGWWAALGLVITTILLTELISNAGAVAIMVPIALSTAADLGADPRRFALGVTLAAASSFLTPIGYQTNTMVFGPGRYHPVDYLRLGLPLSALVLVMAPAFMSGLW